MQWWEKHERVNDRPRPWQQELEAAGSHLWGSGRERVWVWTQADTVCKALSPYTQFFYPGPASQRYHKSPKTSPLAGNQVFKHLIVYIKTVTLGQLDLNPGQFKYNPLCLLLPYFLRIPPLQTPLPRYEECLCFSGLFLISCLCIESSAQPCFSVQGPLIPDLKSFPNDLHLHIKYEL